MKFNTLATARNYRNQAQEWANKMVAMAESDAKSLILVISDMARPWGESETCTDCGKCVQACPTGALVAHGTSGGDMVKDQHFLPILARRRHSR